MRNIALLSRGALSPASRCDTSLLTQGDSSHVTDAVTDAMEVTVGSECQACSESKRLFCVYIVRRTSPTTYVLRGMSLLNTSDDFMDAEARCFSGVGIEHDITGFTCILYPSNHTTQDPSAPRQAASPSSVAQEAEHRHGAQRTMLVSLHCEYPRYVGKGLRSQQRMSPHSHSNVVRMTTSSIPRRFRRNRSQKCRA